ncbi:MAG: aminopeptidase P family protein [Moraxella sp.]|nr:aminopeptidase P family protein [Moraxella sp.]
MNTTIQSRLATLRQKMSEQDIKAVIIPSADPHMSEYLPDCYKGREYFSGFTGSVATLVVGAEFAQLWADSRYWIQGEIQLQGTGIALCKLIGGQPAYGEYLADNLAKGDKVAIDGLTLSLGEFERLGDLFAKTGVELVINDVVNTAWENRPALPSAPIYAHADNFVDTATSEKLAQVRQKMSEKGADWHLISSLDDIAWLTNLRGADVECNPVFLSHLLIGKNTATLFVNEQSISNEINELLKKAGIDTENYDDIADCVKDLAGVVLIDPAKTAKGIVDYFPKDVEFVKAMNPSTLLKAVKSDNDIAHIRQAMVQDGAALCEFFAEFEDKIASGETLDEVDISEMLISARSRQPYYRGTSFDTIAGFGGNGAIVHYRAERPTCKTLQGDGLLLIDSGCQYDNGTTDITRMASVGKVCDDAKRDVTYVLKAHIALARAVFLVGTPAPSLDMIARQPMWAVGLNYGHGTGHGVGYFLNVHEGPQSIAHSAPITPERTMLKGMITSNEPGLYRTDKWGIRIENLVATVPAFTTEFGEFLKFEDLTLCPIDTRLILPELLNADEKDWLNAYHQKVHNALIDKVDGRAKEWLVERTKAI